MSEFIPKVMNDAPYHASEQQYTMVLRAEWGKRFEQGHFTN